MKLHHLIQIFIFVRLVAAQEQISNDYLQRVEKVRQIINELKSPLKTKKYKCIEVDDNDAPFGQNDDLLSFKKPKISRSSHLQYERPKLRQVSLTSHVKPVATQPIQPVNKLIVKEKPIQANIEAPPAVYATGFPRARAMPSRRTQPKVVPQQTVRGVLAASTGKPPLILSPEHCAQIKYYADMYGVTDVLGWVKRNCSFAKMYIPDATCDEINILVASCDPKSNSPPK